MSDMSYPTKQEPQFMNVQGGEKKVMKKILSVALSTAMAFSMFASVAFGETAATPQDKFNALKDKGILNGYPDGQAHLEKDLTRAEFAKIVTKLFNLTEVTNKLSYKDKGYNAKNWAVPYIEAVTAANLMQGKDTVKGIFDYNGKVTVEEVATVLVRALKLETPATTDNNASTWAKGYAQAVIDKGLIAASTNFKGNATRSLVVETAYAIATQSVAPAVTSAEANSPTEVLVTFANGKSTTVTLTTALVEGVETTIPAFTFEGYTYNNVKVTLAAPKVVSVTTPNAKQLVVKFNRAIDASTLISNDKVKAGVIQAVYLNGAPAVTVDGAYVTLNAGGNEATITLPGLEYLKGQYTVVVTDAVKTTTGTKFPAFTSLITVADTTAPTVASVSAVAKTTTTSVTVKFSEPVKSAGIIAYVNGVASAATVASDTYDTFTLTTGTLNSGATYDVSLLNVTDFAGNVANPNPIKTTVTVTSDTAAPTIVSITPVSDKYVDVKFNKKVNYESFVANVRLLDAYGDSKGTFSVVTTSNKDTIRLQVPAGFSLPSSGTFTGSIVFGASVKDTLGNTLGTALTQPITITKDTTAPTVASAVYTSGKGLVVTFSEDVTSLTGAPTLISESTGQIVSTNYTGAVVDGATVTYPNVTGLSGNYTLRLPAALVTDISLSANKLSATAVTVSVATTSTTDYTRPVVTGITYTDSTSADDVVVTVTATDETGLNVATLKDLNSYTLGAKALPSGSYIYLTSSTGTSTAPTAATVKVIIPKSAISETKAYDFAAVGIADTAGNGVLAKVQSITLTDRVAPTLTSAAVSTGDSTVLVLGFSETVKNVDAADFSFTINGVATTATGSLYTVKNVTAGAGNDAGKYYVTFAKADGTLLDLNANNINTLNVKVVDNATIVDNAGNSITTGTSVDAK
ncbi:S-layer homology domain-containing protein [Paenibacillus stellifer]|uniref:S-layer homology domain-containing protein n=1 Tax=Paenibacillus stellifer TaxID=169760 RepID=UPI00068A4293|nr:S-layer homology domain-containing protein [Paenibacillus stellifer]